MAQIHAFVRLDPDRAPEQDAFLRDRVTVLREAGGQFWVSMDQAQVDTFLSQGFTLTTFPDADVLRVGPVAYRPATETPQPPAALRATTPPGHDPAFWIVHFVAPVDKSWLQEIALAGAEQVHVLDPFTGVFRMEAPVAETVRALSYVDSVALFHPAYAVSPELAGIDASLDAAGLAGLTLAVPPSAPEGNLLVSVFDGVDAETIRPAVEATGATIVSDTLQGFLLQCTPEQAQAVLAIPGIVSASIPVATDPKIHNAGAILGVNQVRDIGTVDFLVNLDGTGEIGAVVDTGFDVGNLAGAIHPITGAMTAFHPDLASSLRMLRNCVTPQNPALAVPDSSPHGTHVAGIIASNGVSSAGNQRGMAPAAAVIGLGPLPANTGSAMVPFDFAAANGAHVINNSWGATHGNGRYSVADALSLDRWAFGNPDVLLVFATGNDESDSFGGPDGVLDARTMDQQATAKNVLSVGGSENLRNDGGWRDSWRARFPTRYTHAAFAATAGGAAGAFTRSDNANQVMLNSDRGNVRDAGGSPTGRIKPDVVAPGTNILSTRSQWIAAPPPLPGPPPIADPFYANNFDSMLPPGLSRTLYEIESGTSQATPMVSGAALLTRQYYRTRFAQMRRPLLLEGVAIPAAPPLPVFGSRPSMSPHADGLVCAWITPELPAGRKNVVAMRLGRHLAPIDATPVHLQDDVGDHAAPKIVTVGERTYLLHRGGDSKMRLSCYDRALHLVPGFGTAGVITLAPDTRLDDGVPPDLVALADQVACVFPATGANGYFFQRFRADTGAAVDGASISFLFHDGTGPHRALTWNGTRFTVCGVVHPGNYQLQIRQMDAAGAVQGAGPVVVVDQVAEVRDPCLLWDARSRRHVLVWCDARTVAGGEIWRQLLDENGAPVGAPALVVTVPVTNHVRRPCIALHPANGYTLTWEDDSQGTHFDLYFTLLDGNAQVDARVAPEASDATSRRLVRITDTPGDTNGFATLADGDGFVLAYQSPDEINSDRMGVYALALTPAGAFEAQENPSTPLLKSGRYVVANLLDVNDTTQKAISAAWAGGSYYLLRTTPGATLLDQSLSCVRLNADGAVDASYGVAGVQPIASGWPVLAMHSLWTGNDRLVIATMELLSTITLYLRDAQGAPVASFGTGGAATLDETLSIDRTVCPQVGFFTLPSFRLVVGYGTLQGGTLQLRQQIVDSRGVRVGAAANLAAATGVAPHDWFQFVNGEAHSIAIYHRAAGPVTRVHCRRFQPNGTPDGAERDLSAAAGEGTNGVIARRPVAVSSTNREYGAAWQYRPAAAAPWEIHFSRLDRQGIPMANPPAPAPPMPVSDVVVINGASAGWSAGKSAVEPQLVSTYTHEPWANPPAVLPAGTSLPSWSPAYGLAWIGLEADGTRMLYFTVLDENGQRLAVPAPPPPAPPPPAPGPALVAPVPVGILALSTAASSVRDFKLVWNGRVFFLDWVEEENGHLHHRCTTVNRHANQIANDIPSAALIRATLVNGATNITPGPLPDLTAGYGWGRVNVRQCFSPAPPVTLHVRDDCAIGPGRSVTYRFVLPAGTALLRVTLNWTDPPGANLVNHLHLTLRAPAPPGPGARPEYRGNRWLSIAGQTHLSRPVANPPVAADNHENVQTFKQVVLANPLSGEYEVTVDAATFPADPFNQQNLQPFALIFAGTGPEALFNQPVAVVTASPVY